MAFYDFDEIKKNVSFEEAAQKLGLQLTKTGNKFRGACPACKGADRSLVVTPGAGAYCFSTQKGGDVLWLVSHVRGCSAKDAAAFLSDTVPTVPQKEAQDDEVPGFQELKYLEHDHDAVKAIGLDPGFAKKIGAGYAPKGILRGTIAWPIRDEAGKLLGYIGTEDCKLPPSFTTNVVQLKRA